MKTLLASLIGCALAVPAFAGPDFSSSSPRGSALTASSGSSEIGPLDDVVFAHNSTTLTEGAYAQIEAAARWLRDHRTQKIVLEGYADSTGFIIYNEDLATRRAFVVRQHLVGRGVSPDRVIVVVYGEQAAIGGENPLDRRVVMYATKLTPQKIAAASFDLKNAASTMWSKDKTLFTEQRTRPFERTRTVIGER